MEQIAAQKKALRSRLRQQRKLLNQAFLLSESAALCEKLLALPELERAQTVFCYVSYGGEVETHRLIRQLLDDEKTVVVPRCRENGIMDCVPIKALSELRAGTMGILEPPAEMPSVNWQAVDFAIVPAVACGEDGSRLGQGGGYYDRFLEQVRCPFAAVCLEQFLLPALPCEIHDQPMKIIVTQHRVLRFEEV